MQSYTPPFFANPQRKKSLLKILPEVEELYKREAEKHEFPGYAYGLILEEELIYSRGEGYLDLKRKNPVTSQSLFRIASMTKSFTAMAILKLRDENKLRLDDPLSLYIPEYISLPLTKDSPLMTLRDLLIHTAGFPNDDPWADRKMDESDHDLLEFLKSIPYFSHTIGTIHEYSNLGYTLLGVIITRVTGTCYEKYILENICLPLGMKDAYWDFTEVPSDQLAHGYRKLENQWVEEPLIRSGPFGAMGGLITSVESFAPYIALHLSAWPPRSEKEIGPLKRSSLREMHYPWAFIELLSEKDLNEKEQVFTKAYGYGLRVVKNISGQTFIGHSGGLPGFGSNWAFMPEYGLGVVLLVNKTYAPAEKINRDILMKIIEMSGLKPRELPASPLLEKRQKELLKILDNWENAQETPIFAANFFLDNPLHVLKKDTNHLFEKAGKILSVQKLQAESQLKGSFILNCEKCDLKIHLALTPENPPLIQKYEATEIKKPNSF